MGSTWPKKLFVVLPQHSTRETNNKLRQNLMQTGLKDGDYSKVLAWSHVEKEKMNE